MSADRASPHTRQLSTEPPFPELGTSQAAVWLQHSLCWVYTLSTSYSPACREAPAALGADPWGLQVPCWETGRWGPRAAETHGGAGASSPAVLLWPGCSACAQGAVGSCREHVLLGPGDSLVSLGDGHPATQEATREPSREPWACRTGTLSGVGGRPHAPQSRGQRSTRDC